MRKIGFLAFVLLLSACGSKLDGTYSDELGMTTYKFESGGRVYVSALGTETELKYEVNGIKVKLEGPNGNVILTLLEDGSLQGPGGNKLTRGTKEEKIIGVWEKTSGVGSAPMGATVEFTREGKMRVRNEAQGELQEGAGTYKVQGNSLMIAPADGGQSWELAKIQTLTDKNLVLAELKSGKEDVFTRKR